LSEGGPLARSKDPGHAGEAASPRGGRIVPSGAAGADAVAAEAGARLTVGLVRGLRGLHGHVRVELLTDRPEDRFAVGAVLHPEGTDEALTIVESSAVADGPGWWLRFRETRSREEAERLRDLYLEIPMPDEPRVEGRWYFHELVGLAVRGSDGRELGTVREIYRAGGAEVFLVRGPEGELDVPAVRGIVLDLAPERGEIIVDMDALDLDARPVDDPDYVRPRDRRPRKLPKPKGPRQPAPKQGREPGASAPPASASGGASARHPVAGTASRPAPDAPAGPETDPGG